MGGADRPDLPPDLDAAALIRWLSDQRNDLQPPALTVAPAVSDVLSALSACDGAGLVRMSGSGATVFGLFQHSADAATAAQALSAAHPEWWIAPTILGANAATAKL